VAGEWQPRILDDPNLPQLLLAAFTNSRDWLITRILFESGARVNEVLGLTIGDWRSRQQRERALTTNKGSRGARVKEIWWSSTTARLLHSYIDQDRCQGDPHGRRMEDLPDSTRIFVTEQGNGYAYAAFYFNWQVACQKANLKVTPHQARHWFVTMALRKFESLPEDKRDAARQSLIAYLGWRNPDTLKAYDHHLRKMDFATTHAALSRLVDAGDPSVRVSPDTVMRSEGGTIPSELWDRLSQILDN
jgi:integrase